MKRKVTLLHKLGFHCSPSIFNNFTNNLVKIKLLFVVISRIGARTKLNLELVPELTKLELARTKIKIHLNLELIPLKLENWYYN